MCYIRFVTLLAIVLAASAQGIYKNASATIKFDPSSTPQISITVINTPYIFTGNTAGPISKGTFTGVLYYTLLTALLKANLANFSNYPGLPDNDIRNPMHFVMFFNFDGTPNNQIYLGENPVGYFVMYAGPSYPFGRGTQIFSVTTPYWNNTALQSAATTSYTSMFEVQQNSKADSAGNSTNTQITIHLHEFYGSKSFVGTLSDHIDKLAFSPTTYSGGLNLTESTTLDELFDTHSKVTYDYDDNSLLFTIKFSSADNRQLGVFWFIGMFHLRDRAPEKTIEGVWGSRRSTRKEFSMEITTSKPGNITEIKMDLNLLYGVQKFIGTTDSDFPISLGTRMAVLTVEDHLGDVWNATTKVVWELGPMLPPFALPPRDGFRQRPVNIYFCNGTKKLGVASFLENERAVGEKGVINGNWIIAGPTSEQLQSGEAYLTLLTSTNDGRHLSGRFQNQDDLQDFSGTISNGSFVVNEQNSWVVPIGSRSDMIVSTNAASWVKSSNGQLGDLVDITFFYMKEGVIQQTTGHMYLYDESDAISSNGTIEHAQWGSVERVERDVKDEL